METFLKTINNTIKHWYVSLLVGLSFIALGIYVFTVPLETYITLSVIFSVTFIFSGIFEIFFSIQNKELLDGWGWDLTDGILSLLIGIYLITYPEISMIILPFVVGFTMLFRSIQSLGIAFDLSNYGILHWRTLAIVSVLGIFLSFVLLSNPLFTGSSLITVTAVTFIVLGVYGILLSFN